MSDEDDLPVRARDLTGLLDRVKKLPPYYRGFLAGHVKEAYFRLETGLEIVEAMAADKEKRHQEQVEKSHLKVVKS